MSQIQNLLGTYTVPDRWPLEVGERKLLVAVYAEGYDECAEWGDIHNHDPDICRREASVKVKVGTGVARRADVLTVVAAAIAANAAVSAAEEAAFMADLLERKRSSYERAEAAASELEQLKQENQALRLNLAEERARQSMAVNSTD